MLTNQGEARQYIDYVVNLNRIDSHHHPNEHTILYVFRAPGYDSIVPLSWYKQYCFQKLGRKKPPLEPTPLLPFKPLPIYNKNKYSKLNLPSYINNKDPWQIFKLF